MGGDIGAQNRHSSALGVPRDLPFTHVTLETISLGLKLSSSPSICSLPELGSTHCLEAGRQVGTLALGRGQEEGTEAGKVYRSFTGGG